MLPSASEEPAWEGGRVLEFVESNESEAFIPFRLLAMVSSTFLASS